MRLKSWRMPLKNSDYRFFLNSAAALFTVVFLSGCSRLAWMKEAAVEEAAHGLKKVAVLPFNNISGRKDAAKIVTNTYLTELFKSGRFRVEETGNVLQFMMQERIDVVGEIRSATALSQRVVKEMIGTITW